MHRILGIYMSDGGSTEFERDVSEEGSGAGGGPGLPAPECEGRLEEGSRAQEADTKCSEDA